MELEERASVPVWSWYRVKIGPLGPQQLGADRPEWVRTITDVVIPSVEALEARGEIDRFFFLPEADDPQPHIMLVIHGDLARLLAELAARGAPLRDDLKEGRYESYVTSSEDERFRQHHRLGVALFEAGSRFAALSWQGERALDWSAKEGPQPIIVALWHAFRIGRLEDDMPVVQQRPDETRDVTRDLQKALLLLSALFEGPPKA